MGLQLSRGLSRVVGDDGEHISRFRALDGTPTSLSLLPSLVRATLRRVLGWQGGPWLSDRALAQLRALIRPDHHVLELGSGESSLWLSARAQTVRSYETDPEWYRYVQVLADAKQVDNLTLELCRPSDLLSSLGSLPGNRYSLVIVDHTDSADITRSDSLHAVRRLVSSNGFILLDDSDRPGYADALASYDPWPRLHIYGFKARPLRLGRATLIQRPPS